jgi:hypothetical protein
MMGQRNSEKGTTVAVLISVTEGSIVAYDADKAKFTLGGKPAEVRGFFGDISTDHKHLKLEVETSAVITAAELATLNSTAHYPSPPPPDQRKSKAIRSK